MNWTAWLKSLAAAAVCGVATASASAGYSVATNSPVDLKHLGAVALAGGIAGAIAFLKQSPLPPQGR